VLTDATGAASGINFVHTITGPLRYDRLFGAGVSAADYDHDGDIDVYFPQAFGLPNQLFRNDGSGHFVDATAQAGVGSLKESKAALWFDYDNDGRLDLLVANDPDITPSGITDPATTSNTLYRNLGNGVFAEVSAGSGIEVVPNPTVAQTVGGLAAGDFNNDGFLDVYLSNWGTQNALYRNNGNGTFTEIGASAGVSEPGTSWQPMFHDANRDGLPDLLLNIDFGPNRLFVNQGNETFVNVAAAAHFDTSFNEMGMALGDYDNDGSPDVVATNIESPYPNASVLQKWTVLLHNQSIPGVPLFSECAQSAGVARTGWGWGVTWLDADNDGWLDLAAVNGFIQNNYYLTDPSKFFRNLGNGQFADISNAVGFNHTLMGRGLIAFDADGDGDEELIETNYNAPAYFFRNDTPPGNHWLTVRLKQLGGNRFAVGAEVTVDAPGHLQTAVITAGNSFYSQGAPEAVFGFGNMAGPVTLHVRWPDGPTETYGAVFTNHRALILRGAGPIDNFDADHDDDVDLLDYATFRSCLTGPLASPSATCAAFDSDGSFSVDLRDAATFGRAFIGAP
jgi:hypothetical protein